MRTLARFGLFAGVVVLVLGLSKVHAAWVAETPYSWHTSSRFAWSITYMVVLMVAAYAAGLPDLLRRPRTSFLAAAGAASIAAGAISLVQLATGDALLPRFVVFGTAAGFVPWAMACTAIAGNGRRSNLARDRVLFVGSDDAATTLAYDLELAPEHPAALVGHLNVDAVTPTGSGSRPLVESAERLEATVLVLDNTAQESESAIAQAAVLHAAGTRVRPLAQFYGEWLGKLPIDELERASMLFDIGEVHRARYARLKRVIDVPLAVVGMFPFVLSVPAVFAGNLIGNRGPLFYRQRRIGKDGEAFIILKFRTMLPDSSESSWTTTDDGRITRFGGLLRRWHVDELPQMWNILRGDLAVVGPRPEQPRYVAELSEKLPFYDLRHTVHPGLTGWAQVKYGYAGDEQDALEKLQYEFFYLRQQSLLFDARIIARTARSIVNRGGR